MIYRFKPISEGTAVIGIRVTPDNEKKKKNIIRG